MQEVRLNKALADAGLCSRRKADELIFSGAVTVNGQLVKEPGRRVFPRTDSIAVHGKPLPLPGLDAGPAHTYVLLHKPVQVVSTASDPQKRTTVLDLLPGELRKKRLYPVGRLDYFSEWLLLLTDDGELTNRLTHPRYHLPKEYEVALREKPDQASLEIMRKGMTLSEGERLAPVHVDFLEERGIHAGKTLRMVLRQGVNRQIRRMCRDLGLTILCLRRVRMGPIRLGELPKGKCRFLEQSELAALRQSVDLSPD